MSGFFSELFQFNVYKRTQGQLVRRLTMIGIIALFAWGAYCFSGVNTGFVFLAGLGIAEASVAVLTYTIATLIALFGFWFAYRVVNYSRFADFLIAVEAEMVKVSWPSNKELYITTIVVISVMILLTVSLFCFDNIWYWLLSLLRRVATGVWE